MLKKLVVAGIGAAAMLAASAAYAESPPEPYSAQDPVYTPHAINDAVTMKNGHVESESVYKAPPGTAK